VSIHKRVSAIADERHDALRHGQGVVNNCGRSVW